MSATTKNYAMMLVVGLALLLVVLTMLPNSAAAQATDETPIQAVQDADLSTNSDDDATTSPPVPESERLRAVYPGDNLWSITESWLGPEATLAQVQSEVERIYQLNRTQIGDNPNLILPGQELLLLPVAGPASSPSPETGEPSVAGRPATEAPEQQSAERQPAAAGAESEESSSLPEATPEEEDASVGGAVREVDDSERRVLGMRIITLTLVLIPLITLLAVFLVWRRPIKKYGKKAARKVQDDGHESVENEKEPVGSAEVK